MIEAQMELALRDAPATEALGAALGRAYARSGAATAVVYLHGELGAGKTLCVRSLLRTLGVTGLIRSPTYTLLESYQPPGIFCVHVDLYRLHGPVAVDELGLRDYFDAPCLMLVEWPEKGGAALPPADLHVKLSYRGDARAARLSAPTARGSKWLFELQHDTSLTPYVTHIT